MSLLSAEGLVKEFGGLRAIDGLSVSIDEGELVGVMGPNGAGKSTFFNCVSGVIPPDDGTVTLDGTDVTGDAPESLAHRGLVRTFQNTRELETMTVRDNVRLAAPDQPGERTLPALLRCGSMRDHEARVRERAEELIETFELPVLSTQLSPLNRWAAGAAVVSVALLGNIGGALLFSPLGSPGDGLYVLFLLPLLVLIPKGLWKLAH